ncbi:MAG TPA: DUF3168 domain-containing protein [Nitrobacter sp.]|nr:DUF3168 domain-containing protein [Nitrobacter sp.]
MIDASAAVQRAIRTRLVGNAGVIALVPAASILDTSQRPAPDPSIILGEDQIVDAPEVMLNRSFVRVYSTLHIWKKEVSLAGVKAIANAIRRAIGVNRSARLDLADADYVCSDCTIEQVRFMRDPDGETSHGVMTLNSLVQQRWSVSI